MISKSRILKSMILLIVVFSSFSVISCRKETVIEEKLSINRELIAEVREVAIIIDNTKIAFAMLNSAEKFTLLQEQLAYILENIPLNQTQKGLIQKLKESMPKNAYETIETRRSYAIVLNSFNQDIISILGSDFANKYFTKIIAITKSKLALNPSLKGIYPDLRAEEPPCYCATKSDWCTDPNGVDFYCVTSRSCVVPVGEGGCGTFFLYDCDGLCLQRIIH